jgi:hypothetical protein
MITAFSILIMIAQWGRRFRNFEVDGRAEAERGGGGERWEKGRVFFPTTANCRHDALNI